MSDVSGGATSENKKRRVGTHHDWCVTVHGRDEMLLLKALAERWLCDGLVNIAVIGDEVTGNGGEHAQAFFKFPQDRGVAFGNLKKWLTDEGCLSAHVEPRRAKSIERAANYCLKEHFEHIADMFEGAVCRPDSKPLLVVGWDCERAKPDFATQGKRSDLDVFKEDVLAGQCSEWDDAMMNHSGLCARAEGFVRQFIGRFTPLVPMSVDEWERIKAGGFVCQWVGWAMFHLNQTDDAYNYRKVGVLTDNKRGDSGGNAGKSYFCDWYPRLMAVIGVKVQVLSPGKLADMAMQLRADAHQVIIDIPASRSDHLQWSFVEQLKCGRVDSPKYYSTTIRLVNRPVRVLIVCNHHPDKSRRGDSDQRQICLGAGQWIDNPNYGRHEYTLSNDRWVEYDITHEEGMGDISGELKLRDINPAFQAVFDGGQTVSNSVAEE